MTATFLDRLAARSAAVGTVLCLGLDPDPAALPPGFRPDIAGVEAFCRVVVAAAAPYAAAIKPNLAFFEAFGSDGMAALERIRADLPTDLPVVADAKRGDIGTTASRQAVALFDRLGADAVTVNPYLGSEAIGPLLDRPDRFAYVLCRTSNPGAGEFQDLVVAGDPSTGAPAERLFERVARRANGWGPGGTVGLVVGATAPVEMARIRARRAGAAVPRSRHRRPGRRGRAGPGARSGDDRSGRRRDRSGPAGQRVAGDLRRRDRRLGRRPGGGSRRGHRAGGRRLGPPTPCANLAPPRRREGCPTRSARPRRDPLRSRTDTMPTPGPLELVIILVIALLVLGPGRLPDVGSALGKSLREFRKASSDLQDAVNVDTSPLPAQPAAPVDPAAAQAASTATAVAAAPAAPVETSTAPAVAAAPAPAPASAAAVSAPVPEAPLEVPAPAAAVDTIAADAESPVAPSDPSGDRPAS